MEEQIKERANFIQDEIAALSQHNHVGGRKFKNNEALRRLNSELEFLQSLLPADEVEPKVKKIKTKSKSKK